MPRSQYQYQPLTGPVWVEPVASRLAWMPAGRAVPARTLQPNRLGDCVVPFVAAVAVATSLAWQPVVARAAQPAPKALVDVSVAPPFQPPATSFDAATFPHVPTLRIVRLEVRSPGVTVEPFLMDVPIGVDATWQQPLPRPVVVPTWTIVQPFTQALIPYDPAGLQWLPSGAKPTYAETRRVRASVAPVTEALYRPEGLQWLPSGAKPTPTERRILIDAVMPITASLSLIPYDPAGLQWLPSGAKPTPTERRILLEAVAPFTAALYRPDGLQWLPAGRDVGPRSGPRGVQTWSLLDPFPIAGAAYDPQTFPWVLTPRIIRLEVRLPGTTVEPFLTDVAVAVDAPFVQPPKSLPRALATWQCVQPFIAAIPYDPAGMQWLPTGAEPTYLETRRLIRAVAPPQAALYQPEGLQWMPGGRAQPARWAPRGIQTWFVPQLIVSALYQPAGLQWLPGGRVVYLLARSIHYLRHVVGGLGAFGTPVTARRIFGQDNSKRRDGVDTSKQRKASDTSKRRDAEEE